MSPYSMVCELLLQGRCEPVLSDMQLSQGNKTSSDYHNKIVAKSRDGDIILDYCIKTFDGWVARVKFLHEIGDMRVQSATAPQTKNINDLHIKLSHPYESITHATTKAMGIKVTGTLKPYEDCTLGKAE